MQKHKKSLTLVNIFSSSSQNVRRILQFYEIHRWILTIPKEFDKSTITATVARQVFDKICIYRVKCKSLEKKIANRKLVNNISGFFTCVIYWPHKKTKNRIEPNRIKKTDKSGQAWNVELSNCIERVITREREKEKEHEKAVAASTAATTLYVVDLYRINSPSLCVCVYYLRFFVLLLFLLVFFVCCCCSYIFHGSRHFFPIIVVLLGLCFLPTLSVRRLHRAGGCLFLVFFFSQCTKLCGKYHRKNIHTYPQIYERTNKEQWMRKRITNWSTREKRRTTATINKRMEKAQA